MAAPRAIPASRWLLAVVLLSAAYWTVDLALLRAGPPHPLDDIWEDGVVARHLIAGAGFRTTVLYPPLWGLRDPATLTVPVLAHGPLLPVVLALALPIAGTGLLDHLAWVAAALAVLTAAQVFRLASRWGGPPVGAAAAAAFTLSPILLNAVHHSLSVVLGACLLMLAFDLATREKPRPLAAGLTLGLTYLTRPEMILAAPVFVALAAAIRPQAALALGVGFVAAAAGWWAHQAAATGMPMFNVSSYMLAGYFGSRPELSALRDYQITPDRWPQVLRDALPGLWVKWAAFLPRAARHALVATGWSTGWLAVVGAWVLWRGSEARRPAVAGALLALIPVATMTLAAPVPLYVVPFLGLYAWAAGRGAVTLLERWRPGAAGTARAAAVVVLLGFLASGPALRRAAEEGRLAAALLARERAALAEVATTPRGARRPMFSDRPGFASWTSGRPTLYTTREEYEALYPASGPVVAERPHGLPARRDSSDTWFHTGHWAPGARVSAGSPARRP
jgi:hypothetical protein